MTKRPKLTRLKEWFTLDEAAQYVAASIDEPVSKADVLRLALDKHLTLSVRFPGTVYAQIVLSTYPDKDSEIEPLEQNQIFDLPMTGAERLTVEEAYQRETGGPVPFFGDTDGTFVVDDWLVRYRLFEHGVRLARLPAHAVLVVRRDALDEFVRKAAGHGAEPDAEGDDHSERPLRARERETLFAMIAALCRVAGLDTSQPSNVARAIEPETTRLLGDAMPVRTVQSLLKAVRQKFGER